MTCEQANQPGLVKYSDAPECKPATISKNEHWYQPLFRQETKASLKVDKVKNVLYNNDEVASGCVVDLVMQFINLNNRQALKQLSANQPLISHNDLSNNSFSNLITTNTIKAQLFSFFHQQNVAKKDAVTANKISERRPPFHLHEYSIPHSRNAAETAISNIAAKQPVTDLKLCSYVKKRRIDKTIAGMYCYKVTIRINDKDEVYPAIRFKNSTGGYESRNDFFKFSSASKDVIESHNSEQKENLKTGSQSEDFEHKNDFKTDTLKQIFNASEELQTIRISNL